MKRILISIAVLVGVGGLIALLTFHPKAKPVAVKPKSSVSATASPSSKSVASGSSTPSPSGEVAGASTSKFKDGSYTGTAASTIYGNVQVQAVVSGGKLTSVNFLQMPSGGNSDNVTDQAKPALLQEALTAQSAQVDTVSGATQTSQGFVQSLGSALSQA